MNILFGVAFILVLMIGETSSSEPLVASDETRVALLFLLAAIPPLFAAAQVCLFHWKFGVAGDFEQKRSTLRRFAIWHFLVWLVASITTVSLLQWQSTVRTSWQLDRFPAIDDLMILAPPLVSLIASWYVLFETQRNDVQETEIASARREFVALRCRVYLLMVLIPIAGIVLVKDSWFLIQPLPVYSLLATMFFFLLCLLALMPYLVGKFWSSRSVDDHEGRGRLLKICDLEGMGVSDILVWDTNHSIVNALVAGVFPRYRVLMLSDLMLETFPDNEVDAILKHEAGHLRMAHLPIRLAFILLPAMGMIAMDLDPNQSVAYASKMLLDTIGLPVPSGLVPAALFIVYLLAVTVWLSRRMEFEADLYAAGFLNASQNSDELATAMTSALQRFGEGSPEQMAAGSLTHPSLQARISMIETCRRRPGKALRYRRSFRLEQVTIAGMLLVLTGLAFLW